MKSLAKRASSVTDSVTLAISGKAKALKAQGQPVISFGAGEPDFNTPLYIKEAGKRAIDEGFTRYTPAAGIPELKKIIAEKLLVDNNLSYEPSQIIVSNGAKHCLFNTIFSLCEEGDEVIIFNPYWVTYIEQIKLAGAVPVIVDTFGDDGFKINIDSFIAAITDKTKLVIINSPNNPTGTVYSKEDLQKLADIIVQKDLYIISDEVYEKIIYVGEHVSIASLGEEIKKRTIVINAVSKYYSMTGWRIGYAAAEKELVSAMNSIQSHMTSNANSIAQKAALAAICEDNNYDFSKFLQQFKQRKDYIVNEFNSIPGIKCQDPEGAFYAFPDVSSYFNKYFNGNKIEGSVHFCNLLLDEALIAVVPGIAFGNDSCVRFSYALGLPEIKEGIDRFKKFLIRLEDV